MYYIFVTFFTTRRPCHYLCSHNGWVFLKCATIGTHFRHPSDEQLQHRDISCNKNLLSVSFEYDTLLTSPHIQVAVEKMWRIRIQEFIYKSCLISCLIRRNTLSIGILRMFPDFHIIIGVCIQLVFTLNVIVLNYSLLLHVLSPWWALPNCIDQTKVSQEGCV